MKNSEKKEKVEALYKALPDVFVFSTGFSIAKGIGFTENGYRAFLTWEIGKKRIEPNINKYKKR